MFTAQYDTHFKSRLNFVFKVLDRMVDLTTSVLIFSSSGNMSGCGLDAERIRIPFPKR